MRNVLLKYFTKEYLTEKEIDSKQNKRKWHIKGAYNTTRGEKMESHDNDSEYY